MLKHNRVRAPYRVGMGTALVTGATSGIGAEFARQLAARGSDIVLVARDLSRLQAMADEVRALGRRVEVISADLTDADDTSRVARRLADRDAPIDALVNNAGFRLASSLVDPDVPEHDRGLNAMVRAVLVLAGAVAPVMRDRGEGAIINVASINGQLTLSGYSAIKAWVRVYSESLAGELHGSGVTVTALMPGWVRTGFHRTSASGRGGIPRVLWLEPERVVRECLRDADRGRVLSIPSKRYRVLSSLLKHLPDRAIRAISRRIGQSRSRAARQ